MAIDTDGIAARTDWVLGTISGTSADAIDLALIATDGHRIEAVGPTGSGAYRSETRDAVLALAQAGAAPSEADARAVGAAVTHDHLTAIRAFLDEQGLAPESLRAIGFHGQTVFHDPVRQLSVQLGNPSDVAAALARPTVGHLRQADLAAGGQGAPIVPAYHATLAADLPKPLAILNVGGVSNVTLLTTDGAVHAADLGPGNAPLDDWVRRHTGADRDEDGRHAAAGSADTDRVAKALSHPFYDRPGPKSLDRADFSAAPAEGLGLADGAATLLAIAVGAVARARDWLPERPKRWLVCGGGRHNPVLMDGLRQALGDGVDPVEAVGWDGDALEAQAMAFLAARRIAGLPTTWPGTTGCGSPTVGGVRYDP